MRRPLLVVGAGPKAIAIAAKAAALKRCGFRAPQVVVIEMAEVAAHWCGSHGYTDGDRDLCTSPEKDLGFPYDTHYGEDVAAAMRAFSWHSYLTASHQVSRWLDEGQRTKHKLWVDYLRWAAAGCGLKPRFGRVREVSSNGSCWLVKYVSNRDYRTRPVQAGGIVITGPGQPLRLPNSDPDDDRVSDAKTFWTPRTQSSLRRLPRAQVLVIGAGDTAATIVLHLIELSRTQRLTVFLLATHQPPRIRLEDPDTNAYFSQPGDWSTRKLEWRREFIKRADRGVISADAWAVIDKARRDGIVRLLRGRARDVLPMPQKVLVTYDDSKGQRREPVYDHVVEATGFDPLSFESLFSIPLPFPSSSKVRQPTRVERVSLLIEEDLSVGGVQPKLHLPMLSALGHGPGLPSLTCLGLVSDRILNPYVSIPRSAKHKRPVINRSGLDTEGAEA